MHIENIEDRMFQVAKRDLSGDEQVVDVVNIKLLDAVESSWKIIEAFRTGEEAFIKRVTFTLLHRILDDALLCLYVTGLMPPEEAEDVKQGLDDYSDAVAQDGILSACAVLSGASNAMLVYHEEDQKANDDFLVGLGEMLCGVCMICERLGVPFEDLVHDVTLDADSV